MHTDCKQTWCVTAHFLLWIDKQTNKYVWIVKLQRYSRKHNHDDKLWQIIWTMCIMEHFVAHLIKMVFTPSRSSSRWYIKAWFRLLVQSRLTVNCSLWSVRSTLLKHIREPGGWAVRTDVSGTWNVLSWSGGLGFESQ